MEQAIAEQVLSRSWDTSSILLGVVISAWIGATWYRKKFNGGGKGIPKELEVTMKQIDDMHQFYEWKGREMLESIAKDQSECNGSLKKICRQNQEQTELLKKIVKGLGTPNGTP